jgi:hypothetical protein
VLDFVAVRRRVGWWWIYQALVSSPPRSIVRVSRRAIDHPAFLGAKRSIGLPLGQLADWRFPPDAAGRGLHVREFRREWHAHIDRVHPSRSLLGHFLADVI